MKERRKCDGGKVEMGLFRLFFSLWEEIFCVACGVVLVCSRGALGDIIIITPTFRWIFRWIFLFFSFSSSLFFFRYASEFCFYFFFPFEPDILIFYSH